MQVPVAGLDELHGCCGNIKFAHVLQLPASKSCKFARYSVHPGNHPGSQAFKRGGLHCSPVCSGGGLRHTVLEEHDVAPGAREGGRGGGGTGPQGRWAGAGWGEEAGITAISCGGRWAPHAGRRMQAGRHKVGQAEAYLECHVTLSSEHAFSQRARRPLTCWDHIHWWGAAAVGGRIRGRGIDAAGAVRQRHLVDV